MRIYEIRTITQFCFIYKELCCVSGFKVGKVGWSCQADIYGCSTWLELSSTCHYDYITIT